MRIRWSITIPEETDRLVRSHLARRGMKKGDLSRFADYAVRKTILREIVNTARMHNRDTNPNAIEDASNRAVEDTRAPSS